MRNRIQKLIEKFKSGVVAIDEYNEMLERDYSYYTGYGRSGKMFSFNVKLHGAYFPTDVVEDYIKTLPLNEQQAQAIREEFSENRLEGIYQHYIEDMHEGDYEVVNGILFCFNEIDPNHFGYYGRSGGWLCLGDLPVLEVGDTELGQYPIWKWSNKYGTYINWDSDTLIDDLKDFHRVTNLKDLFTELKRDLNDGDFGNYVKLCKVRTEQINDLEKHIRQIKDNAKKYLIEFLHNEIDVFIDDEFSYDIIIQSAEQGDISRLDYISRVDGTDLITQRNARVPADLANQMIQAIIKGLDVCGKHIGPYTVNAVTKGEQDTYVKIGCHLFALNRTQSQINSLMAS
jgi:heme oxygenase